MWFPSCSALDPFIVEGSILATRKMFFNFETLMQRNHPDQLFASFRNVSRFAISEYQKGVAIERILRDHFPESREAEDLLTRGVHRVCKPEVLDEKA